VNFGDVQDELGTRLDITGLRVSLFEPASITGPTAIFAYPNSITFDETTDGQHRLSLRLVVAVPNPTTKQARDSLAGYCAATGVTSVKAALEDSGDGTAFDTVRVSEVVFDGIELGATPYAAAIMTIDVTGA
jgi:hypothetical protein